MSQIEKSKKAEIEQIVRDLHENFRRDTKSVDILDIAHRMGFKVGNADLSAVEDGYILVDSNSDTIANLIGINTDKLIGVNKNRPFDRKRFTIAHELGHYILHYPKMQSEGMYAHRENVKGKGILENEADYFAACILMPEDDFFNNYKELKDKGIDSDTIAVLLSSHYVVPFDSAKRRIDEVLDGIKEDEN